MQISNSTLPNQMSANNSATFLEFDSVAKIYSTDKGKGSYTVLEDVNLSIQEGEFVCVIGHSGCGKSTLLSMVSGLNKPSLGEIRLKNQPITKPGPDRMVIFQNYSLLPWKTAYENVYLAVEQVYKHKSAQEKKDITLEHLELVGLTEAIHKKPAQLSGGMKQRVAIARALATRPEVLIMDEPFGALDPITREEMQEELVKIWQDHRCTVLMITHDIDEALFLSDRLVMMTNGPSANIGEVLDIPFPRPRDRQKMMEDSQYFKLRNHALDFLFRRFAHDDALE
jgi:nitrate/nitrite transport system ATP-binding protein